MKFNFNANNTNTINFNYFLYFRGIVPVDRFVYNFQKETKDQELEEQIRERSQKLVKGGQASSDYS